MLFAPASFAQKDEYELKAQLILSISEETGWTDESDIHIFQIGVVGDQQLFNKLYELLNKKSIHSKRFTVKYSETVENLKDIQVLVIDKSTAQKKDLKKLIEKNILSIAVDNKNYTSSCVNVFVGNNNQLEFTVNAKMFEYQLLKPKATLLVYATNKEDAIRMIEQAEKELNNLKQDYTSQLLRYNTLHEQLTDLKSEITSGENRIKILEEEISKKEQNFQLKNAEINRLEAKMQQLQREFTKKQIALKNAFIELKKSESQFDNINSQLNKQVEEIRQNQEFLNAQNQKIKDQEQKLFESGEVISSKTRVAYLFGSLAIFLVVILFFIQRENKSKKESIAIINKKNEEIVAASKHKDEFISNLSHELRTPLNAVIGYTELVKNNLKNEENKKHLETVIYSSRNLLKLINDILDIKKIESGKLQLEQMEFELKSMILETFQTTELLVTEKKIEYVLHIDDHLPDKVIGDATKLNQVLLNLLGNAAKFTEKGKIELNVTCIEDNENSVSIKFEVKDTGIGISEDQIETIFDSFTQGSENITKKYGGTGLGLTIARKYVNLMGGDILVKSKIDVGTSFSFTIPLNKGMSNDFRNESNQDLSRVSLGELKIIFADDLAINRDLFLKQLKGVSDKIQIDLASDGNELVQKVLNKDYDIVVTDVQMPKMNGVEATKLIRESNKEIKIIGLSANIRKKDIDLFLEAGMNDYISKPYNLEELILKISDLVGIKEVELSKVKEELRITKRFERIWNISGNQEEYQTIVNNLINELKENLVELNKEPYNKKLAHSLLNKVIYLDNKSLENSCRSYEELCSKPFSDEIRVEFEKLNEQITQFLDEVSNSV